MHRPQPASGIMEYNGPSLWKRFRIWFRRAILRSHPEQETRWTFKMNLTQIDPEIREKSEAEIRAHDPAFRDTNLGGDGIHGHEIWAEEIGYWEYDHDKGANKWRRLRYTERFWYGTTPPEPDGEITEECDGELIRMSQYLEYLGRFKRMFGHSPM